MTAVELHDLVDPAHTVLCVVECQNGVIGAESSLPALAEEANALAAALGARVLFDEMASPVTDLTVVIGADFHLGG